MGEDCCSDVLISLPTEEIDSEGESERVPFFCTTVSCSLSIADEFKHSASSASSLSEDECSLVTLIFT